MFEWATVLFLAFILDLLIGDPPYRFHPVRLMGGCIRYITRMAKNTGLDGRWGGILLVITLEFASLAAFLGIHFFLDFINGSLALGFDLFICYSCLALKDLLGHTGKILDRLKMGDLAGCRKATARVVGRDVRLLDEKGISRATIETMSENFVDGFLSPLFWYLSGGILGSFFSLPPVLMAGGFMITFKVASTLDSMVGYKDAEFRDFGWAGAKFDDIMNFIPARLSLPFLFVGALLSRLKGSEGIRVARRDRLKHDSPNAAHAESFVAGALGVRLGGPTLYPHGQKDKAWLGGEYVDPTPLHIRKTASLLIRSAWVAIAFPLIALVMLA